MHGTGIDQIIANKYVLYVLHDTAVDILRRFPNCKIVNLIDVDIESTADRYMKTTALFPIHINTIVPNPWYVNAFNKKLIEVCSVTTKPTYRDFWAYDTYKTLYVDDYDMEYKKYVSKLIRKHNGSLITDHRVMNTTWESMDILKLIEFFNASLIDEKYTRLLHRIVE
jgi:hypothetical protein